VTIQFFCPSCDAYLRTAESKAGLSLACPACRERIWVPHADEVPDADNPWGNVEQSTAWDAVPAMSAAGAVALEGSPAMAEALQDLVDFEADPQTDRLQRADIAEILGVSWRIYSNNLGICLLATFVDILLTVTAVLIVLLPAGLCIVLLHDSPILAIPASMLTLLVGWTTALSAVAVGHYRFFLALARGEPPKLGEMFRCSQCLGPMAVASVGFWAVTLFGFFMFVIPGLLVLVLFWPYGRFVVDDETPASLALDEALRLTSENFWTSALIVLLNFLVIAVANVIPLLGYFFAIPFAAVLHTVAYLHFRGEFVTGERAVSEI
jgi:hypothetical protein